MEEAEAEFEAFPAPLCPFPLSGMGRERKVSKNQVSVLPESPVLRKLTAGTQCFLERMNKLLCAPSDAGNASLPFL